MFFDDAKHNRIFRILVSVRWGKLTPSEALEKIKDVLDS